MLTGGGDNSTQNQRGDTFGKTFVVKGSSQSPLNNTAHEYVGGISPNKEC